MTKADVLALVIGLGIFGSFSFWYMTQVDQVVANCVPNHELKICE